MNHLPDYWNELRKDERQDYLKYQPFTDKANGKDRQAAEDVTLTPKGWEEANKLKTPTSEFTLVSIADVDPKAVDWTWPGYLAKGKLTLLGGDPDLGKSLVCIDAAATLSKGRNWPGGSRAKTGATLFICSEDGIADTIRPRAEAAEADLNLLKVFKSTLIKDGKSRSFNLGEDLGILGKAIESVENVSLVVVDAITSYMGKIDSHRTTDVRAVLEPIAEFAEHHGVSILGVTHPPKAASGNALRAFTGSFAFVAAPRVAFFVTSEPETDRRLLLPVKNNIGPKARGQGYFIRTKYVTNNIEAPCILWDDAPVDVNADQAIAAASSAIKDGGALNDAKEFLRDLLANGPVDAKEGEEAGRANGISVRTLDRARKDLGVKSDKTGYQGRWQWTL
jgi:putative DNA primase/helicase